ncbi:MAG: hypothetical protein ACKKL6_01930 [Candidatus Komeilibacteria bacterium]
MSERGWDVEPGRTLMVLFALAAFFVSTAVRHDPYLSWWIVSLIAFVLGYSALRLGDIHSIIPWLFGTLVAGIYLSTFDVEVYNPNTVLSPVLETLLVRFSAALMSMFFSIIGAVLGAWNYVRKEKMITEEQHEYKQFEKNCKDMTG